MVKPKLGVVTGKQACYSSTPGPVLALDDSDVHRYTRLTTQDAFLATDDVVEISVCWSKVRVITMY